MGCVKKEDFIDEVDYAFSKMIDLLSKQSYTKAQLKNKMQTKKFSKDTIEKVLAKLCEYKYVDDKQYAQNYVKQCSGKLSKRHIEYKLIEKGVPRVVVYEVMNDFVPNEDTIIAVAEKYMKNKSVCLESVQKLYAYLFGKGFEYDEIARVVAKYKKELKGEDYDN